MKKYKVKPLSVSGLGKKIHRAGDVVTEKNFPSGTVDKLVLEGFLVPYDGEEGAEDSKLPTAGAPGDEPKEKNFVNAKGETSVVKTIKDITKNELLMVLSEASAKFDSASSKEVLFDLWMSL